MLPKNLLGIASLSLFALVSSSVVVGCAADMADAADETTESDDSVGVSADELSKAGKALVGTYLETPAEVRNDRFRGLVLSWKAVNGSANKFIADVDTGIRCIVAPCPSGGRIEGTFTATKKTITLRANASNVAMGASAFLGTYRYSVSGDQLTLKRAGFEQTFDKGGSFCDVPADCELQDIVHVMCAGHWTCSESRTCGYTCGMPIRDVCEGKDRDECLAAPKCAPQFGPSACSPDGRICTADIAYKGCFPKN
ncbi:MAG: hypothetical protein U0169_02535 [Polyangiaceae bacterium]